MKEELLEKFSGLVDLAKDGVLKGVEVIQMEAPELVKEIIRWSIASNIFLVIIFVILTIISFKLGCWFIKRGNEDDWCDEGNFGGSAFSILIFLIALSFSICCSLELVKILVAPKLFLIEYIKHLII